MSIALRLSASQNIPRWLDKISIHDFGIFQNDCRLSGMIKSYVFENVTAQIHLFAAMSACDFLPVSLTLVIDMTTQRASVLVNLQTFVATERRIALGRLERVA